MSKQEVKTRIRDLMKGPKKAEKLINICFDGKIPKKTDGRPRIVFKDFQKESDRIANNNEKQ